MTPVRTVVPQHLGELHGSEQLLVAVIALGPFAVLAALVAVRRRRDRRS